MKTKPLPDTIFLWAAADKKACRNSLFRHLPTDLWGINLVGNCIRLQAHQRVSSRSGWPNRDRRGLDSLMLRIFEVTVEYLYKMPLSGSIILRSSSEISEMEAIRRVLKLIRALVAEEDLNWTLVRAGSVHNMDTYLDEDQEQEISFKGLTIGRAELIDRTYERANGE